MHTGKSTFVVLGAAAAIVVSLQTLLLLSRLVGAPGLSDVIIKCALCTAHSS